MDVSFFVNNATFFIFVILLSVFLYVKRDKLDIQGSFPIFYILMYKTSLGLERMDKWSRKHPKIFLYLAYLSFFIGVVGMFFSFGLMVYGLDLILEQDMTAGGGLVLPLKTEKGLEGAVPVFYVPFWYWLIALFILVIVHEFAHGVISERFKVRVKSSGFAFLGILAPIVPAAFVEPDEKQLSKKPRWQQIAVFGAGSTSNFIFGFLFLAIWIFGAGPLIDSTMTFDEFKFNSVMNESSLYNYGITNGSVVAVNGNYDKIYVLDTIRSLDVNQTINLTINSNGSIESYPITTFEHTQINGRGMIGISGLDISLVNKEGFEFLGNTPLHFERLLFYIWMLNIAIGIMNLLPLWITDGGQIARLSFEKFMSKTKAISAYNFVSLLSLILLIFTIWPSTLRAVIGIF